MTPEANAVLQTIGTALDEQQPLQVRVDGVVALRTSVQQQEKFHERQRKSRSATRSRSGSAGGKRATGGSRQTGASSRLGSDDLRESYEGHLADLLHAYPSTRTFDDEVGMWLLARSSILEGLTREARFLVTVPYRAGIPPRAWGFWVSGCNTQWIGPRHTNFQDGSICAFAPSDNAWREGDKLSTLLDLYSVWALRHLHLEVLGRWPGKQYGLSGVNPVIDAFYRSRECQDDELCGCGSETLRYAECCKSSDRHLNFVQAAGEFRARIPGGFGSRRPPAAIVSFMEGRSEIPKIAEVHLQMSCP